MGRESGVVTKGEEPVQAGGRGPETPGDQRMSTRVGVAGAVAQVDGE